MSTLHEYILNFSLCIYCCTYKWILFHSKFKENRGGYLRNTFELGSNDDPTLLLQNTHCKVYDEQTQVQRETARGLLTITSSILKANVHSLPHTPAGCVSQYTGFIDVS